MKQMQIEDRKCFLEASGEVEKILPRGALSCEHTHLSLLVF